MTDIFNGDKGGGLLWGIMSDTKDISYIIAHCKALNREYGEIKEKIRTFDTHINKVFYGLYREFTDKNWLTLSKDEKYYLLLISTFDKPQYREIYFDKRISDDFCTFVYANPKINMNINQFSNVKEEDYKSNEVLIDKEQLERIKQGNELKLIE